MISATHDEVLHALQAIETHAAEALEPGLWPRIDLLATTLEHFLGTPCAQTVAWAHYEAVRHAAASGSGLLLVGAVADLRDVLVLRAESMRVA